MASKTVYKVTAAAAVVRVGDSERYFYRGAVLPDAADEKDVRRLVEIGLVSKTKVEVDEPTGSGGSGKPAANAGEEKWREYATSLGLEVPADADKAKIRELVAEHEKAGQA